MKSLKTKLFFISLLIFFSSCSREKEVDFVAFNIYQEGTKVDNGFHQIKEIIVKLNPDVIGFTEVRNYDGDWTTKIQQALKQHAANKTTIFIAHRLSSVQHATKIIVLDDGEIVQIGTAKSLLLEKGYYRQVFDIQQVV